MNYHIKTKNIISFFTLFIILSIIACYAALLHDYRLVILFILSPFIVVLLSFTLKNPHWALIMVLIGYMYKFQIQYGPITSNIALIAICLLSIFASKNNFNIYASNSFLFWSFLYFIYISFSYYFAFGRFDYYELNGYLNNIIIMLLFYLFDSNEKIESFYKTVMWCSLGLVFMGFAELAILGMPRGGMKGFYPNHVVYALHIAWGIPFAAYLFSTHRRKVYLFVLLILLAGIMLAYSRGVIMALLGSGFVGVTFISWPRLGTKRRLKYLSIGCLVSILLAIGIANIPTMGNHLNTESEKELTSGRSILYQSAWKIFKENPMTGSGWEKFRDIWSDYTYIPRPRYGEYFGDKRITVHSSYLKVLTELGILGFMVYAFFNICLLKELSKSSMTLLGKPLLFLMLIYYFHGLVDNNSYGNDRMFYFVAGLLFSIKHIRIGSMEKSQTDSGPRDAPMNEKQTVRALSEG